MGALFEGGGTLKKTIFRQNLNDFLLFLHFKSQIQPDKTGCIPLHMGPAAF